MTHKCCITVMMALTAPSYTQIMSVYSTETNVSKDTVFRVIDFIYGNAYSLISDEESIMYRKDICSSRHLQKNINVSISKRLCRSQDYKLIDLQEFQKELRRTRKIINFEKITIQDYYYYYLAKTIDAFYKIIENCDFDNIDRMTDVIASYKTAKYIEQNKSIFDIHKIYSQNVAELDSDKTVYSEFLRIRSNGIKSVLDLYEETKYANKRRHFA